MNRRIHTGTFDEFIAQAMENEKRNSIRERMDFIERDIEGRENPRAKPRVLMENNLMEHDYPHTRKYRYVRPYKEDAKRGVASNEYVKPGTPPYRKEKPEVIPRRRKHPRGWTPPLRAK